MYLMRLQPGHDVGNTVDVVELDVPDLCERAHCILEHLQRRREETRGGGGGEREGEEEGKRGRGRRRGREGGGEEVGERG